MAKVILDAGHGGSRDPGAVYEGRQEKDDVLRLALAVGEILERKGVEVSYNRVNYVYVSTNKAGIFVRRSTTKFGLEITPRFLNPTSLNSSLIFLAKSAFIPSSL